MIEWIRRHFRVVSSSRPVDPILFHVDVAPYYVCTLTFFGRSWSFSIHCS